MKPPGGAHARHPGGANTLCGEGGGVRPALPWGVRPHLTPGDRTPTPSPGGPNTLYGEGVRPRLQQNTSRLSILEAPKECGGVLNRDNSQENFS